MPAVMKKALVIAYYFPPLGLGGVQRMAKLAKYLPQFGWQPIVLTVKPIRYHAFDKSLLDEISGDVVIYRSGSRDPARMARFIPFKRFFPGFLSAVKKKGIFWPDSKMGWEKPATRLAMKIIHEQKVELILSSSPPITAHLVAMAVHEMTGLPWVADFRDIWESRRPEQLYGDHTLIEKSYDLLERIAASASAVTAINRTIGAKLTKSPVIIPGGFDEDDLSGLSMSPETGTFTLCYLGSVGPLHPLEPFLKAVRIAAGKDADFAREVKLKVIGANDRVTLADAAHRHNLHDRLTIIGYLPHRQALTEAAQSSVLLLSVPSGYDDMMTGKVFDYLALPRPILASVPPDGEAAVMVRRHRAGIVVSPDDNDALAQAMLSLYYDCRQGKRWIRSGLNNCTRRATAQQFAGLFDDLVAGK